MAERAITMRQILLSYWPRMLTAVVKEAMGVLIQIMTLCGFPFSEIIPMSFNDLFELPALFRTCNFAHRVNLLAIVVLYQTQGVSALPVSSGDTMTDIATKSYDLTRTSFITMAAMGAVTIMIALVQAVIAIAKLRFGLRLCQREPYELPRHPAICENSAEAHAALGQRISGRSPPNSGQELSVLISETVASPDANERCLPQRKQGNPQQEAASMPAERLSRISGVDSSV
ncbi:hypothetical protein F5Y07DRAFT_103942 [Xylaria sp. FL0933]|nr:hypothetical protein F5Y07DRAFT_103942 [Xylaria sp. FL0933]